MSEIAQDRRDVGGRRWSACVIPLVACMMLGGSMGMAHSSVSDPAETASADEELIPATVTLAPDGVEIRLDGDLAEGTAKRLRALLRAHPGARALSLESDGGLVDEAEQVGDIVAAHGLSTIVRTGCVSACTLAFVRARVRMIASGAKLGFHAPWTPKEGGGEEQLASDDEKKAYVASGIAPDFVDEALAVPSSSIWFPEDERLLRAGVVTSIISDAELSGRIAALGTPSRLASAAAE